MKRLLLYTATFWLILPTVSHAYEGKLGLGGSLGYAHIADDDKARRNGAILGVQVAWSKWDNWFLQGGLEYALYPSTGSDLHVGLLSADAIYTLDIVRLVPLVGFGLSGALVGSGGTYKADFGPHALLGLDYWIRPKWVFGVEARLRWFPFGWSDAIDPLYFTLVARFRWVFDLSLR